ncbi:integrin alpha-PS3-like, partial [Sitodiplosis mosellana]|uniref:integrin alpha-PS3-like n=1 Tax=Sitodiplosis mosellana TaxID=263140 RepID=UPI00244460E7
MICSHCTNGFNVSPVPNIVFREPKALNNSNSYFGYSVNLKANGVLIGAPRARSNSPNGQFESGAVYKCDLNKISKGDCQLFNGLGNIENLNGSWLGMSMDSGARDNEAFVVCAPRFTTPCEERIKRDIEIFRKHGETYEYKKKPYGTYDKAIHGNCYWGNEQKHEMKLVFNFTMKQLLDDSDIQVGKNEKPFKYYDGEHGFSVHITDNNKEILMGVPGSAYSRGLVIRKKINTLRTTSQLIDSEVPNPRFWDDGSKRTVNTYFGFSISSGYFDGPRKSKLLYVAGAPRDIDETGANNGAVYIFDFQTHYINWQMETVMKKHYTFNGEWLGEYFGYSVLVEDFDNDGLMDIAIGAPYRSSGAVYIYKNRKTIDSLNFKLHCILHTTEKGYYRDKMFGAALMKVGDINQDGYNDLIVSAPFEGNGAIYIYHGSTDGLLDKPAQKIHAPSNDVKLDQMFGYGLSKGVDLDGNNYVDFAVGAPNAGAVYIYKTYPVIRIDGSIKPIDEKIPISAKTFDLSACFRYESNHKIEFDVQLRVIVKLIDKFTRAHFQIDGCNEKVCELNVSLAPNASSKCVQLKASVKFQTNYIYKPIHMELNHSVINAIPKYDATTDNSEFCETCVALDPKSVRNASNVIKFDPGCKHEHCVTDLRVTSALSYNATKCSGRPSFKRGDSSLTINYTVENHGESAY